MNLVQTRAMRVGTEEMTFEKQLSKFWELESLGISPRGIQSMKLSRKE